MPSMVLKRENESLKRKFKDVDELVTHLMLLPKDVAQELFLRLSRRATRLQRFSSSKATRRAAIFLSEQTTARDIIPPIPSALEFELMVKHPISYPALDRSDDAVLATSPLIRPKKRARSKPPPNVFASGKLALSLCLRLRRELISCSAHDASSQMCCTALQMPSQQHTCRNREPLLRARHRSVMSVLATAAMRDSVKSTLAIGLQYQSPMTRLPKCRRCIWKRFTPLWACLMQISFLVIWLKSNSDSAPCYW